MSSTMVASSFPPPSGATIKLDKNSGAPFEYLEQPKALPEMKLTLFDHQPLSSMETGHGAESLAQRLRGGAGGICWCSCANMFTCGICAPKSNVAQERANPIPTKPPTRPNPGNPGQRLIAG
ncbi:hypothetical protein M408DRAFT_29215 [Serendipita vermifera MAFF 305830]|uniref:Uncharacterized protein n=1 Tax=Serendipita vermifera MAFF 305830 TaxID=933852 RepID=A0A0C3ARC3_SERVB|nr:hypothetical protein M408DRAFT_29215 [Serendipita vermifera MAFF 305830]